MILFHNKHAIRYKYWTLKNSLEISVLVAKSFATFVFFINPQFDDSLAVSIIIRVSNTFAKINLRYARTLHVIFMQKHEIFNVN